MNVKEIVAWLHANPREVPLLLETLRVLGPWQQRQDPHRSGCEEWERIDLSTNLPRFELYRDASWMRTWGAMDNDSEDMLPLGETSNLEETKERIDRIATQAGWVLLREWP